jgi:hypothetical protein
MARGAKTRYVAARRAEGSRFEDGKRYSAWKAKSSRREGKYGEKSQKR